MAIDLTSKRIVLTGGSGFLGKRVTMKLIERGVGEDSIIVPRSGNCDLRIRKNCVRAVEGADIVIHLAANVGGIGYNMKYPASLFYDNAVMGIEMMEASRKAGVEKFVAVGTVCSYPKYTPVPFKETDFWNGFPEETNAPYGIAKKMLLVQAEAYRKQYGFNVIYLVPVNLYGPEDHFDLENSHVIPALIMKFYEAKKNGDKRVVAWGTGNVSREFLYVDDAAEGIVAGAENYEKEGLVNLGAGREIKIRDLVYMIKDMVGYEGAVVWDETKPDGQPRRMLDTNLAYEEFGFRAKTSFEDGLSKTIKWYGENLL